MPGQKASGFDWSVVFSITNPPSAKHHSSWRLDFPFSRGAREKQEIADTTFFCLCPKRPTQVSTISAYCLLIYVKVNMSYMCVCPCMISLLVSHYAMNDYALENSREPDKLPTGHIFTRERDWCVYKLIAYLYVCIRTLVT